MSAFYDLKERDDKKWKKHSRDILKLTLLLTGKDEIKLVGRMKDDFNTFITHIKENLTQKVLSSIVDKFQSEKTK